MSRSAGAALLVLLGVVFEAVIGAAPAMAARAHTGYVLVPGTTRPMTSGGSKTPFELTVPQGAHCPGDSTRSPWYQARSYLLATGTSPAAVTMKGALPSQGLWLDAIGGPWEAVNLEPYTAAIPIPPQFYFDNFTVSDLFPAGTSPATWNAGIACANARGVVSDYWNVQFTFTMSTADPRSWTWTVAPHEMSAAGSTNWRELVGALVLISCVVLAILVYRRAKSPEPTRGRGRRRRGVGL